MLLIECGEVAGEHHKDVQYSRKYPYGEFEECSRITIAEGRFYNLVLTSHVLKYCIV